MVTVIPTSSAEHLIHRFRKSRDISVLLPGRNREGERLFPDGEVYTKIESVEKLGGRVVVLHAGMPNPNIGLIELDMLLEILKTNEKVSVEVFFTYFSYGMQDKAFEPGETNVAENIIKRLVNYYGVQRVYAIDAHFHGRQWINRYPFTNLSAVELLKAAAEKDHPGLVYATPDAGSHRRTGIKGTKKKRIDSYNSEMESDDHFAGSVRGNVVAVIDDLLETGGTLDKFYDECKKCGARDVVALITHGVLPKGISRIVSKYPKLYLTNSINRPEANVDISELIITALTHG
ncbi:MAG: ribose-phosphate pyrophosphokinase-like domain-containing protein [Patescibacteria group bacterium]